MIYFDKLHLENSKMNIFLWGTGSVAKKVLSSFKKEVERMNIRGFIDNDVTKQDELFYGYQIYSPNVLCDKKECFIIILCDDGENIAKQIHTNFYENVCKCEDYYYFVKYRLMDRYRNSSDEEILKIVDYVRDRSLHTFNYPFVEKYHELDREVLFDEKRYLYYTCYANKKMYFNKKFKSVEQVRNYLKSIIIEQDKESPHCYSQRYGIVKVGDVVVDAGAAEGNFSLSVIDKVKKIYILEPDKDWVEALQYTFEPYKDKVEIVGKYLSDYNSDETITLDRLCLEPINFLKMDIEGEEYNALQGGKNLLRKSENIICSICTYHNEHDYTIINDFFKNNGMRTYSSQGYMWFPYDKDYWYSLPSLRKGLIFARKKVNE